MKKFLIFSLVVTVFSGCSLFYTQGFNTYFWTSTEGSKVYLYIDGENKGVLPYLPAGPDCDNEELKKQTLMIHLPSATYDISVKDSLQQLLYGEELTVRRNNGSLTLSNKSTFKHGGSRRVFKDSCLIEELFYEQR
ncbi:MAG: hypothetical protein EOO01_41720 [Chitinophagaceae bacterium]|nr:MAG: hypothetical protein EOO01_41720 [Chitinophagaceae bacterium]